MYVFCVVVSELFVFGGVYTHHRLLWVFHQYGEECAFFSQDRCLKIPALIVLATTDTICRWKVTLEAAVLDRASRLPAPLQPCTMQCIPHRAGTHKAAWMMLAKHGMPCRFPGTSCLPIATTHPLTSTAAPASTLASLSAARYRLILYCSGI